MQTRSSLLPPAIARLSSSIACRRAGRNVCRTWLAILTIALLPATSTYGQPVDADAGDGPAVEVGPGLVYLSLGPTFVSNYDGGARLKYLQTDVSVRVHTAIEELFLFHLPAIRNRLVVLLAAQLEENLTSTQGREALRRQALEEVRDVLRTLESDAHSARVVDLYFTTFVVQG